MYHEGKEKRNIAYVREWRKKTIFPLSVEIFRYNAQDEINRAVNLEMKVRVRILNRLIRDKEMGESNKECLSFLNYICYNKSIKISVKISIKLSIKICIEINIKISIKIFMKLPILIKSIKNLLYRGFLQPETGLLRSCRTKVTFLILWTEVEYEF